MNTIYNKLNLQIETIIDASAITVRESILNRRHIWSYNWQPFSNVDITSLIKTLNSQAGG
jgi:hypothetical protein